MKGKVTELINKSPNNCLLFPFFIAKTRIGLIVMRIVFCSSVWILIFVFLSWRLITIARQAFSYLHRLHQIPCSGCAFFTQDYRLKCTVNPITAMSEAAIGCNDFVSGVNSTSSNNQTVICGGCSGESNIKKHLIFNTSPINNENTPSDSISMDQC